jgi:NAD(P)H-hydrate epimerase
LFPTAPTADRIAAVIQAAQQTGAIILSKGARTIISNGTDSWAIDNGTPALARGGSGDILTGLCGGLLAAKGTKGRTINNRQDLTALVASANWWHAQAGSIAARECGMAGVDAVTLSKYLAMAIGD